MKKIQKILAAVMKVLSQQEPQWGSWCTANENEVASCAHELSLESPPKRPRGWPKCSNGDAEEYAGLDAHGPVSRTRMEGEPVHGGTVRGALPRDRPPVFPRSLQNA
jgi:hypothetical protein